MNLNKQECVLKRKYRKTESNRMNESVGGKGKQNEIKKQRLK